MPRSIFALAFFSLLLPLSAQAQEDLVARVYCRAADKAIDAGAFPKADELARKALAHDPHSAAAFVVRAYVASLRGDVIERQAFLRAARDLLHDPLRASRADDGRLRDLVETRLADAIQSAQGDAQALFVREELARAYAGLARGDDPAALAAYQKVLSVAPKHEVATHMVTLLDARIRAATPWKPFAWGTETELTVGTQPKEKTLGEGNASLPTHERWRLHNLRGIVPAEAFEVEAEVRLSELQDEAGASIWVVATEGTQDLYLHLDAKQQRLAIGRTMINRLKHEFTHTSERAHAWKPETWTKLAVRVQGGRVALSVDGKVVSEGELPFTATGRFGFGARNAHSAWRNVRYRALPIAPVATPKAKAKAK